MKILSIETSCDETAMALVEAEGTFRQAQGQNLKFKILKNLVASQVKVHRPYGGVVPQLAKREHLKNLPILFRKIFKLKSYASATVDQFGGIKNSSTHQSINSSTVDVIVVTVGPGLEPALWTGINFAKDLAKEIKRPLIGVNHLEGHLYSFLLAPKTVNLSFSVQISKIFPAVALIVSGGHTILLLMKSLTKWEKLGETRDDAAGEAFDKVAKMLGLPYPGGPEIERLAKNGNATSINFPRPMANQKNYDFSFSGLKTAVLYYLRGLADSRGLNAEQRGHKPMYLNKSASSQRKPADAANIAASFQQAVIDVLTKKTMRAADEFGAKSVILCGGVAANKALRRDLQQKTKNLKLNFFVPDFEYNTDNAAMIAAAGYVSHLKRKRYRIAAQSNLNL